MILLAELALLHVGVLLRLYVLRWEYPQGAPSGAAVSDLGRRERFCFCCGSWGLISGSAGKAIAAMKPGGRGLDSQRL